MAQDIRSFEVASFEPVFPHRGGTVRGRLQVSAAAQMNFVRPGIASGGTTTFPFQLRRF